MPALAAFTNTAVKVVLSPAVMVGFAAVKAVMPTLEPTVTVAAAATLSPAALVTASVKVVLALRVPEEAGTPLLTSPTPLSMVPVPPLKWADSWLLSPMATVVGEALKELMAGGGTTVTVSDWLKGPPVPFTVSV
jgi:hypothetical protein